MSKRTTTVVINVGDKEQCEQLARYWSLRVHGERPPHHIGYVGDNGCVFEVNGPLLNHIKSLYQIFDLNYR